ncbi:PREDICTED: odorant receptor 30a-like [Papilio xuthus]|uniref:Odorant receptor n=1 Tax=Papilio xuthus TaxID=66420 RepID=A0AAJ6ZWM0_PAPXU|nr:PREDICTED: odorant receptor 30a-like [Papilio xuthus]WCC57670.1 odorant receptor 20 [Papilio xuthus]
MTLKRYLRDLFLNGKKHFQRNNLESLLWMINLIPNIAEITKETAAFWALHFVLLLYIYGLGCLVYQVKFANGPGDFIKSYVNVSIFTLTATSGGWFLMKWPFCKNVLKNVIKNDELARQSEFLKKRHSNLLSVIKKMLLVFYISNMMNVFLIYLPNRADLQNDNYSMTQCVGLEPLSTSPNREVCQMIILTLELSLVTIVLNYQALLLLLIAHTTAMYQLMADEMTALNEYDNENVKEKLPIMILRHSITMRTVDDLKLLYSVPIGIHFGSNAVCICLFFYLPLQDWITFIPVLMYCFLVYFLYCFLCQRLINASEEFERAVYCCGWEKFDLNEMKLTYMMLMQAQKPIELLAAGIVPVNIYTFATSMQAMFKFVTVVKF